MTLWICSLGVKKISGLPSGGGNGISPAALAVGAAVGWDEPPPSASARLSSGGAQERFFVAAFRRPGRSRAGHVSPQPVRVTTKNRKLYIKMAEILEKKSLRKRDFLT